MCHTTSRRRNSCGVTPACCRIPQMLAYTVVHVALVVFVNLLSYCAECRSHLAVAHMVLGTRSVCVCVCVRSLSKHMTFTHGFEYWINVGLLGSLGNIWSGSVPQLTLAWQLGPSTVSSHSECTHYITAQHAPGLARKQWHHRSTVHCLYKTLFCSVKVQTPWVSWAVCNMQTLVKKKYTLVYWTKHECN